MRRVLRLIIMEKTMNLERIFESVLREAGYYDYNDRHTVICDCCGKPIKSGQAKHYYGQPLCPPCYKLAKKDDELDPDGFYD